MPLVKIQTNVSLDCTEADALAVTVTGIVARELGKPESVMMVVVDAAKVMTFGATGDPTALFEIEGIDLSSDPTEALVQSLSDLAESELGVSFDRVFVKLTNVPRGSWGGNRKIY